jgi:radical SAM superfamily enzyme YgiQ (UPF0313 family)
MYDLELISINDAKFDIGYTIGIDLLQHYLKKEFKCKTHSIFFKRDNSPRINYDEKVAEIGDLQEILKLVENFNRGKDLLEEIEVKLEYKILIQKIENLIEKLEAKFIGFSTTYINFFYSIYAALRIRQLYPDKKIIFGGYQVTLSKKSYKLVTLLNICDFVVSNDGREPLKEILNGDTRKEWDGKFLQISEWPEYNKAHAILAKGIFSSITSFGCPFNCDFCASKRKYTPLDLNKFSEYLKTQKANNFNILYLADDTINPSKERALNLSDSFMGKKIQWSGFGNALSIDSDVAKKFYTSGCRWIFIGAETFSKASLCKIHKPDFRTTSTEEAISHLCEQNIEVGIGIITGMPEEKEDDFLFTFNMLKKLKTKYGKLASIIPTSLKIYPSSRIYSNPGEYGIEIFNYNENIANGFPREVKELVSSIPDTWKRIDQEKNVGRERLEKIRKELHC